MIPDLLIVALDYFREPRRFPQLSNPGVPLPAGITELLATRSNVLSEAQIGETARQLNATESQCREALPFFVKQVMLEAGGDHYRTLGLPRTAKNALIKQHYHYLIRLFHPDREANGAQWDDVYAARINEAYGVLRDPRKRHEYDSTLPVQDGFGPRPRRGFPPAPAPGRPASQRPASRRPASRRVVPPAAGKAALLLFSAIAAVVVILLLNQSGQPRLRVQSVENGELGRPLLPPGQPGERPDLSWESGEFRLDPTDEVMVSRPSGDTDGERSDTGSTGGEDSQSIEDIVRERVAEATLAVLGPPRKSSAPSPENDRAVAVTVQKAPAIKRSELSLESTTVIADEMSGTPVAASAEGPGAESSTPGDIVVADTSKNTIAASMVETQRQVVGSARPPAASRPDEPEAPGFEPSLAAEGISGPDVGRLPSVALAEILKALRESYELGDAEAFARLFSVDARTTDATGKDAILTLYSQFFALPERRDMTIRQFTWNPEDPDIHIGHGVAYIVTQPFNGGEPAQGELLLQLKVQKQPGGFRITEMEYRYQ